MKHKIFCIYDDKSLTYGVPVMYTTTGVALRMFAEIANDQTSLIGKYPSDHHLYELGTYDDSTANFETYSAPRSHGFATGYLTRPDNIPDLFEEDDKK